MKISRIVSPCLHVDALQISVSIAKFLNLPGACVILKVPDVDWPANMIASGVKFSPEVGVYVDSAEDS